MFVIDVFKRGGLFELGIFKQPLKPKIIAVSFFILHQQAQKFFVREIRCFGMLKPLGKAVGHAEELERVERGKGLFVEHKNFSPDYFLSPFKRCSLVNGGTLTLGGSEIVVYRAI